MYSAAFYYSRTVNTVVSTTDALHCSFQLSQGLASASEEEKQDYPPVVITVLIVH